MAACRMDDDAGGLVDNQQVVILVGDREVGVCAVDDDRRLGPINHDQLARLDAVSLWARPPVDAYSLGVDQVLGLCPGAERLREEPVQASAGCLLRNADLQQMLATAHRRAGPRARAAA